MLSKVIRIQQLDNNIDKYNRTNNEIAPTDTAYNNIEAKHMCNLLINSNMILM